MRDDTVFEAGGRHEQISNRGRSAVVRDGQRVAGAGDRHSAQSSATVKEFVEKAGTSGLAEVELGQLGVQKATNSQGKAFAKRMVADHTKANQELLTAIKGKGVQVPSSQTAMHKATMEKFRQQDAGKNFHRDYIAQMIENHNAAVELLETAADDEKFDPAAEILRSGHSVGR